MLLPSAIIKIEPAIPDNPTEPQTDLEYWRKEAMVLRAGAQEASEKLARANIRASQFQQKYD